MPTISGQYQLQDYIAELQARGFDGFSVADLTTYINRGYFHIARRSRWYWEKTDGTFVMNPGTSYIDLSPAGPFSNFRSLEKLLIVTAGKERKLRPLTDEQFFEHWLGLDLTVTANQGEPGAYYVYRNRLYILNPPNAQRTFRAFYTQRVTPLVNPTDVPITPQHLDEAVILGALIRTHKRANEPTLAAIAESDLEEFFDDMRDDEEELMEEAQDRVLPDNSWL